MNLPDRRQWPRQGIRMDARLDPMTRTMIEELAAQFHQSRASVLRQVMRWGLSREPSSQVNRDNSAGPVQHLFLLGEAEPHQQVKKMAEAAGGDATPGYSTCCAWSP
jgi:hypothetical protein